jgi:hypothetical protein
MTFRRIEATPKLHATPVELFHDLRPRKIAALYAQQQSLLSSYAKHTDAPDVALQGATGSGKTLVALLIAEWRRRRNERPLYLCPTRQLANQVTEAAKGLLGLSAIAFLGSRREFSNADMADWKGGRAIGVAAYSALFNTNPFFDNPTFVILDDAHATEQGIADYWTVRVSRLTASEKPVFEALASRLKSLLPADDATRLAEAPATLSDQRWVQIIPAPLLWPIEAAVSACLDEAPRYSDRSVGALSKGI